MLAGTPILGAIAQDECALGSRFRSTNRILVSVQTKCGGFGGPSPAAQTATWQSQKHEIFAEITMAAATEHAAETPPAWLRALKRCGDVVATINAGGSYCR